MDRSRKTGLIITIVLSGLSTLGIFLGNSERYDIWLMLLLIYWCLYAFGCVVSNMAARKGYFNKFFFGYLFGFIALWYWSFVPPAWDHPEYNIFEEDNPRYQQMIRNRNNHR